MSRSTLAVVVFVAVAAGAVGFVLGRTTSPVPDEIETIERDLPPGPEPRPAPPPPPEPAGHLVELGSGVVRGRVVTEGGEPIEDVRILLILSWSPPLPRPWHDLTLEEKHRLVLLAHRRDAATRRETRSDQGGTFRLEGLVDGTYRLVATRPGYRLSGPDRAVAVGDVVEITGKALSLVEVTVLLPDGSPAPKAQIEASCGNYRASGAVTPDSRDLDVSRAGEWTLRARTEDHALVSDAVTVTVGSGRPPTPTTLRLTPRPGIRGRVVWAEGTERRSIHVNLFRGSPTIAEARNLVPFRSVRTWEAREFEYAFPDLEPGAYSIRIHDGLRKMPPVRVTVGENMVDRDLVRPAPDPRRAVLLRVIGPDGLVPETVYITPWYTSASQRKERLGSAAREPEGVWRVGIEAAELEEGHEEVRYRIEVGAPGLGNRSVECAPGDDREITVQLERPARLRVQVAGYAGSDLEGQVWLEIVPAGTPLYHVTGSVSEPDARGRKTFGPLAPGRYDLRLRMRAPGVGMRIVDVIPVELASGETIREVTIPPLHSLTVRLEGGKGKRLVRLRGPESVPVVQTEWTDVDGTIRFQRLPAGRYEVSGAWLAGKTMVELPGTSEIRLTVTKPNALLVTIEDPAGYYARAGLRTGDLIIGLDGKPLEQVGHASAGLIYGRKVRLTVRREGRRLEIPVDARRVAEDREESGARFEPAVR